MEDFLHRRILMHQRHQHNRVVDAYRDRRGFRHGVVPLKREVRYSGIVADMDILSYAPNDDGKVGMYVAAHPLTPENNYFEVDVLDLGTLGAIGVGLVPASYDLDKQPGWGKDSIGYHGDDGRLFKSNGHGRVFGPKCSAGDRIGVGATFEQIRDEDPTKPTLPVFFTINGKEIGTVFCCLPSEGLFPAVGLHSDGEEVRLRLDAEWERKEVILMSIDNCEEEWVRLHDVRLNGHLLEYTGRGKSIIDVGLAQARSPLDTTNHYFEIEIQDPGENCYIAIGLARGDYPKHRHPGWNKGSIAYHADDGKIFIGSGVGDPFGPRCHKGDIMGCGILFPRDYNSEADSEGSHDGLSPEYLDEGVYDYLEDDFDHNSDSEDEEWWEKPYAENGTKVEVFFTRNGKTVGRRGIRIPKGGFYPTIGMLSSEEKVRFDLRPLTG